MHELAIAQSIVRVIAFEMERTGARSVRSIDLELGALEGLHEAAIRRAFEVESAGTPLEGSDLRVTISPAAAACTACGSTEPFLPSPGIHGGPAPSPACPRCGGATEIRGGRGFAVRSAAMVLGGP